VGFWGGGGGGGGGFGGEGRQLQSGVPDQITMRVIDF